MLVADVHERMPAVGQAKSARCRLGKVDGVTVPVGELEVRAHHQGAVGARVDSHVFAETLTEEVAKGIEVDGH